MASFTSDTFADGPAGNTPITAAKLNNLETAMSTVFTGGLSDTYALVAGTVVNALTGRVHVSGFGAKGDVQGRLSCAITSGSPNLTDTTASFLTTAVAGQKIAVAGAGTAGAALVTTILTVTDNTHLVLAANASTTVTVANYMYGTDDSTAITSAINAAALLKCPVQFDAKSYFASGLVAYSGVHWYGASIGGNLFGSSTNNNFGGTTLVTTPGANVTLVKSNNFATLTGGTVNTGAPERFGFHNMVFDGAGLNSYNTSGFIMELFGSAYEVTGCAFQYGAAGGVWTEWGNGGSNMEARWDRFTFLNNGGHSLHVKGPHDSQFANGIVAGGGSGQRGVWVDGGKAAGAQFSKVHVYGPFDWCWYVTTGSTYVDCKGEGATVGQFYLGAGDVHLAACELFNGATAIGLQVGDAGIFPSYCTVGVKITGCQTPINVVTDSGYNDIRANVNVLSGGAPVTGTWLSSSMVQITSDKSVGSQDHAGSWQVPADITAIKTHANALRVRNDAALTVANIDTTDAATVTLKVQSPTTTSGTPDILECLDKNGVQQFAVTTGGPMVVGSNSSSHLRGTSGRTILDFRDRSSAVNQVELGNNVTGSGPTVAAIGSDTNVDLSLVPKGAGGVKLGAARMYSGSGAPNIAASVAGDFYLRTDTPSTANQRLYVATGANTWTGIL